MNTPPQTQERHTWRLPAGVSLRRATPADDALLRAVFASTRQDECALLERAGLSAEPFLAQQYDAQRAGYESRYPDALLLVVLVHGVPAGRLWLDEGKAGHHVLDVALLPHVRGSGVGTVLLRWVADRAAAGGGVVTLSVARSNPARRLYERLGFTLASEDDAYIFLRLDAVSVS